MTKADETKAARLMAGSWRRAVADEFPWATRLVRAERAIDGSGWVVRGSVYHGKRQAHFFLTPGEPVEPGLFDQLHAMLERPAGPVAMRDVEIGQMVGDRPIVKLDRQKRLVWLQGRNGKATRLRLSGIVRLEDGTLRRLAK